MNDDISFSVRNQLRITFHYIGLVKSAYSRSASLSLVRQTSIASFLHSAGLGFPSSPPPLPTLPSSLTSPSSLLCFSSSPLPFSLREAGQGSPASPVDWQVTGTASACALACPRPVDHGGPKVLRPGVERTIPPPGSRGRFEAAALWAVATATRF